MPTPVRSLAAVRLLASVFAIRIGQGADELSLCAVVAGDASSRIAKARLRKPDTWQQLRDFSTACAANHPC